MIFPIFTPQRILNDEPRRNVSNTEALPPSRLEVRTENEDPRFKKSNTDVDPSVPLPTYAFVDEWIDIFSPNLATARKDSMEPSAKWSKTLVLPPTRPNWRILTEDPR
jgi:hypothetical protein